MTPVLVFALLAAGQPAELVAHWTFDEGGANAAGVAFAGRPVGRPAMVAGKVGAALSFDGDDDAVVIHAEGLFDGWPAASVAAWVRPHKKPKHTWPTLIEKASGGKPRNIHVLWVGLHGPSGRWAIQLATDQEENLYRSLKTRVRYGVWSHVAVVVDLGAHKARLYVDGKLARSRDLPVRGTALKSNPSGACAAGMIAQGLSNRWKGAIDELRVYRGVLSAAEVSILAAGK